jgi:NTP pyrophosphatase (non-canonical NTP hydrolase)
MIWNDIFKLFRGCTAYCAKITCRRDKHVELLARWTQDPMTLNEYQKQAFTVAKYPEHGTGSVMAVVYCGLGLGEAGEVQGKIKKVLRDFNGQITPEVRDGIIDEASDALWYISSLCTELGITLDMLAKRNLEKLFDRQKRGVICGSGDKR